MRENKYRLTLSIIIEGTSIDNALRRCNDDTGILSYADSEVIDWERIGKSKHNKVFVMPAVKDEVEN